MAEQRRTPAQIAQGNGHAVKDHEHRDIAVGHIFGFVIGLAVFSAVSILALVGLWKIFEKMTPREPALAIWPGPREVPPTPRLQIMPERDLQEYLRSEQQKLASYGWVDKTSGRVRLPIDRAIDLVAKSPLPSRAVAPQQERPAAGQDASSPALPPLYRPAWEQPDPPPADKGESSTGARSGRPPTRPTGAQETRTP